MARSDECLRHLEKDHAALSEELNAWRLESTNDRGDMRGRLGVVEGKIDVAMARLQEHAVELKDVLPRLAVLEEDSTVRRSFRTK